MFDYNFGGDMTVIDYDTKSMKINQKMTQSKSTAYMLVYINKSLKGKLLDK